MWLQGEYREFRNKLNSLKCIGLLPTHFFENSVSNWQVDLDHFTLQIHLSYIRRQEVKTYMCTASLF